MKREARRRDASRELLEARGDATEVLRLVEEALDRVALVTGRRIDRSPQLAFALGRNTLPAAPTGDEIENRPGV